MSENNGIKMDFPTAMRAVINGKQVMRASWQQKEIVFLFNGFLSIKKADGNIHRLFVSDGDLIGDDWIVMDRSN